MWALAAPSGSPAQRSLPDPMGIHGWHLVALAAVGLLAAGQRRER